MAPKRAQEDRERHIRETFQRLVEESLLMTEDRDGSLTIHFQRGVVRKSEWRLLNDEDPNRRKVS